MAAQEQAPPSLHALEAELSRERGAALRLQSSVRADEAALQDRLAALWALDERMAVAQERRGELARRLVAECAAAEGSAQVNPSLPLQNAAVTERLLDGCVTELEQCLRLELQCLREDAERLGTRVRLSQSEISLDPQYNAAGPARAAARKCAGFGSLSWAVQRRADHRDASQLERTIRTVGDDVAALMTQLAALQERISPTPPSRSAGERRPPVVWRAAASPDTPTVEELQAEATRTKRLVAGADRAVRSQQRESDELFRTVAALESRLRGLSGSAPIAPPVKSH